MSGDLLTRDEYAEEAQRFCNGLFRRLMEKWDAAVPKYGPCILSQKDFDKERGDEATDYIGYGIIEKIAEARGFRKQMGDAARTADYISRA